MWPVSDEALLAIVSGLGIELAESVHLGAGTHSWLNSYALHEPLYCSDSADKQI